MALALALALAIFRVKRGKKVYSVWAVFKLIAVKFKVKSNIFKTIN